MEEILQWVRSGLLFGIFSSVIVMLVPNKAYQKHVSLVVGLLFILVMIHPVLVLLQIDESTYRSYIRNYLSMEGGWGQNEIGDIHFYEKSIAYDLRAKLTDAGYPVQDVFVDAQKDGTVEEVTITLTGEINHIEPLEQYISYVFGEEVEIRYEAGNS